MRNLLRRLDENGERWLMLWLYSFIVMVIFLEVVRRFAISYSSVWGEETARYAFIYLVWIGAAVAVKDRTHIRIDVLMHYLPPRGKAILYLIGDLLTMVVAGFAIYLSMESVLVSWKYESVTDGLRIIQVWFLMAVPFGFTIMLIRLVQSIRRDIVDLVQGRAVFEGRAFFE